MAKYIAYYMHHDGELGTINTQGEPGHIAAEAMQRLYRSEGKPDGITWKAADDFVSALIASARLERQGGKIIQAETRGAIPLSPDIVSGLTRPAAYSKGS